MGWLGSRLSPVTRLLLKLVETCPRSCNCYGTCSDSLHRRLPRCFSSLAEHESSERNDHARPDSTVLVLIFSTRITAPRLTSRLRIHQQTTTMIPERYFVRLVAADKVSLVRSLQARGEVVMLVGDGVNDSPALAAADVGVALRAGTGQAMETADVVLMRDDVRGAGTAIDVSQLTMRKVLPCDTLSEWKIDCVHVATAS